MSTPTPVTANANVTVDDFDPLVRYADPAVWRTPDPSVNPTWFNASRDVTGSVWHEATYHLTSTPNARLSFNFTSSSLYIYGASNGSYAITLDPRAAQPFAQTITPSGGAGGVPSAQAEGRVLLYGTNALRWDRHELVLENKGGALLVDLVVVGAATAQQGSSVRNTTIEDTSPAVRYVGNWTTQTGPTFSNGTSTYTRGGGNGLALDFEGSAVYLYGDQVNDHGFYEVYVDQGDRPWEGGATPNATLDDRSGCGGGWAKACEKLSGLKYYTGGLAQGRHTLAMRNLGVGSYPGDPTFFDFDRAIITVPDAYPSPTIQNGPCPFINCNSTSPSASGGAGGSVPSGSASGGLAASLSPSGSAAPASSSRAAGVRGVDVEGGMGHVAGAMALGAVLLKWLL